jgi:hypothetical protein
VAACESKAIGGQHEMIIFRIRSVANGQIRLQLVKSRVL